jgi:dTDP-4-amino-4,6-dideoxygalactose transaminase
MTGLTIPFVGINRQYNILRTEILDATDTVLRSGQLVGGNYSYEFEHWLARKNRTKYAVTCHSGTQALEIMASWYMQLASHCDLKTVMLPTLTYPATANAFIRAGWDVYFVDTDRNGIIDFHKIPKYTEFTVVVIVGLYGAAVRRDNMLPWPSYLIEDAAQHWLAAECRRISSAAISFDPTKNFANYGNGGAIVTNDRELYDFALNFRRNGLPGGQSIGTNSRMSEVDCAQMMVKTRYIDSWQERRSKIARYWMENMQGSGIKTLITPENFREHSFHKFVIEVDNRDAVKSKLAQAKVETKVHYDKPLHEIGFYRQYPGPDIMSCASALSRRVLSLPIYPELTDLEIEYINDQVLDVVSKKRN